MKDTKNKNYRRKRTQKNITRENKTSDGRTLDDLRAKRRRERQRQVMITRGIIAGAALLILLAAVILIIKLTGRENSKTEGPQQTLASADVLTVPHLSFDTLVVNAEAAGSDGMTVEEFNEILQLLYDNDYILVSVRDLANVTEQKDGSVTIAAKDLELPEGKKPLVLSQNDVSYPLTLPAGGYASKLLADESGNLVSEYHQPDGTTVTGAYDVISCLEAFLEEHPDFSWQGSRGIIGVTGQSGILGYRTDELFGKSAEEGNIYADYGTFDTASETASAQAVLNVLKEKGWEIASQGYSGISYASEYALVVSDMDQWKQKTEPVVGSTDLLLYPQGTDIASWKDYSSDDQKYTYLKEQGFDFFFNIDSRNPYWVQIRSDYFRQGRIDARTYLTSVGLLSGEPESVDSEPVSVESSDSGSAEASDSEDASGSADS